MKLSNKTFGLVAGTLFATQLMVGCSTATIQAVKQDVSAGWDKTKETVSNVVNKDEATPKKSSEKEEPSNVDKARQAGANAANSTKSAFTGIYKGTTEEIAEWTNTDVDAVKDFAAKCAATDQEVVAKAVSRWKPLGDKKLACEAN